MTLLALLCLGMVSAILVAMYRAVGNEAFAVVLFTFMMGVLFTISLLTLTGQL